MQFLAPDSFSVFGVPEITAAFSAVPGAKAEHPGEVVFMNPVAERLTGFSLDVARGRPCSEVFRTVDESLALVQVILLYHLVSLRAAQVVGGTHAAREPARTTGADSALHA